MITPAHARLRIGELAAAAAVSTKTVRYYEQVGLLPHAARSESGYRLYTETDLRRLRFIARAKTLGFSLAEVRDILDLGDQGQRPCRHVQTLLDRHVAALDEQLRALQAVRAEMQRLRALAPAAAISNDDCVCGIIEHEAQPLPFSPRPAALRPSRATR